MDGGQLRRLGELLQQWFPRNANCEFTIEANPNDVTEEVMDALAAMGANRLSLGVQSMDGRKLTVLEREHTARDTERAVRLARQQFADISLDLMFGAPGESTDDWQRDLSNALELEPEHVSAYGLTYEHGTSFWTRRSKHALVPVREETERTMYIDCIERLSAAGFEHYEISNFARPGRRSRHNQVYWSGGPYHAVGPGATRYVDGRRETNHRSTFTYLKRVMAGNSPVAESEQLPPEDRARERLVFGLRLMEGVDANQFAQQTGYQIGQLAEECLDRYVQLGFLQWIGSRLRLTREGLLVSDSLWPDLLRA